MQTVNQASSHSFVVKFWIEEHDPTTHRLFWRGHVTHVLSGERRHFQSIEKMNHIILPYLTAWDETTEEAL